MREFASYPGGDQAGYGYQGERSGSGHDGTGYGNAGYSGADYSGADYSEGRYGTPPYEGGGYSSGGYASSGYDGARYDGAHYDGAHRDGAQYDGSAYDGAHYDTGGYDRRGYEGAGHDGGGYDSAGYDSGGYDRGGYDDGSGRSGGYRQLPAGRGPRDRAQYHQDPDITPSQPTSTFPYDGGPPPGREYRRRRARYLPGRCGCVPGPHLLPSRNTVRLEPRRAFRREATSAPAPFTLAVQAGPGGLGSRCSGPPGAPVLPSLATGDSASLSSSGGMGPTTAFSTCAFGTDITLPPTSTRT